MSYLQIDLPGQARGDTWVLSFQMLDADSNTIDITGNQYTLTLKASPELIDLDAELQYGPLLPDGAEALTGLLTFIVPSATTELLTPGTYYYDLQEVTALGVVSTLIIGKVRVRADITRSTI